MSLKKKILVTVLLMSGLGVLTDLSAQYWEGGFQVGVANYRGDLSNNTRNIYLQETNLAGGLFLRYNMHSMFSLRLMGGYAGLSGQDANSPREEVQLRNLSFRSHVMSLGVTAEVNLPGYDPYNLRQPFSPYLLVGLNGLFFIPQTELEGEWVNLQPLGTEGQGLAGRPAPYSRLTMAIPMGLGMKFAVTDLINLGLEFTAHRLFTDYVDDVGGTYMAYDELLANGELAATLGNRTGELLGTGPVDVPTGTPRGDDSPQDWYFTLGINVSWNFLDNGLVGGRGRNKRRQGCQTF
jgi:hypothetical protein